MVGLHSAIREQRRDRKSVSSEVTELDSFLLDEPLTDKFDPLSSPLQDFEDLGFIDDWICEPDCFEMADTQTSFDKDIAAAKEITERNKVREECSPISFTLEAAGTSPSDVDSVGVMIGEVCLDGDKGILSEHTYLEHTIAQNECRNVKNGCPDGIRVKTEKSGCEDGKTECPDGSSSLSEKDGGISMGKSKNVTSSGVSVTGPLLRPKEECVENANSVKRTWNNMEMSVLEKNDSSFDSFSGFEHRVDNFVKSEEFPMGESHNVANKGDGLSEILTPGATLSSNEENADNTSLIHGTGGGIPERSVLKNCGVHLDEHRGFESAGPDAQCPSGESEETLMETSKILTISGNGVSGLSVTGHNEGHTNIVQGIGYNTKNEVNEFKNTKVSRIDYSDVESGEIVSEDDGEECTGLMKPDCEECIDMVEPDREHCIDMVELDGEGCAGMVESDSDYCSDSLLGSADSDYSEEDEYVGGEEEGEIKVDKGRRKLHVGSLDYDFGSSDDEVPKGPIRSKHELEVLGTSIVVEGRECHTPLNEGTILWSQEKRLPLGFIDEVFGPVKSPFYLVRFNTVNDVPDFAKEGVHVSYVPQFASYVLNDPNLYKKGYDASGDNDEELFEEVEFSDDEKEAGYKREKISAKRGAKSTQNVQEKDCGRARKKPEFIDYRKNKFSQSRFQQNANYANGLKVRAQEVKFPLKKPFENSYRNGPHVSTNQVKDCSVTSFQHMPESAQSRVGLQTSGMNHKQKSSQHLSHQGGFVKQAVIRSTESGNPRHGLHFSNGAPSSHGRVTGGIHPMRPSFVAGKSLSDGDYKANSSTSDRGPSHDQAQISHLGQSYAKPMHDSLGQSSPVQHHTGTLHDPMGQTSPGQSQFRPVCGPAQGFHPTAVSNLGQPPGGPMPNGQQTNVNHMGFPPMPVHPAFMGQPAQGSSIQQAMAFMAWNAGRSNHVAGGSQLLPPNANQGAGNPLNFNQMHTCVGIPVLQQPGLYTNMGALPAHNLMPWGQQTIPQGNTSHLPSQSPSIPFSQPNNMSGTRPPHPSQVAKDSPLQHN
ncbi:uncharacterized protein LOC131046457 isoform X2 [Cryptomeria japonica]|uniref:uncharacterized protein LOC131046457 isoform X2 n=1 Tax=Cryptomeria japonica TaxID=3369 RepID=UPI0027DA79D1|nr:uncharacterized protein LOC131046457 isoform X2 [Cryptomeria japonica]